MTTQLYIRICKYLRDKIQGTPWEGHVFTVGGCCRDMVLGHEIKDVDLAINLPNGGVEFALWLHQMRLTTGHPTLFEKYGTAMLRLRAFPHDDIELVQTRAEKYTDKNSRNPETAFGSITDDCLRRDLTINALYYDITADKMLDISGRSLYDIKHKVIATPQDPDSTYDDDPIRILRTIRFATRLGWDIPVPILEAMSRNTSRLNIIKPERMRNEFEKILLCSNAGSALDILRQCGAMQYIVPEVTPLFNMQMSENYDISMWQHTIDTIDFLPPDLTLRWSALLCDTASAIEEDKTFASSSLSHARDSKHYVLQALMRLKYHQPMLKDTLFLCANHECTRHWGHYSENMQDSELRRLQFLCGRPDKLESLLTLIDAYNKALPGKNAMPQQISYVRIREAEMEKDGSTMFAYHLPFAERRIKKILHIEPGPLVEDTLEYMMQLAFANPLRSRQEFEKLVSMYHPQVSTDKKTLISEELRPSAQKRRGESQKVSQQKLTNMSSDNKKQPRRRYYRHRRRKKSND